MPRAALIDDTQRTAAPLGSPVAGRSTSGPWTQRPKAPVDPAAVVHRLALGVRWPTGTAVAEREWKLVARTPDFDAWLIAWPPGGHVALHDHGASAGAIRVMEGALTESVPLRGDGGKLRLARRELVGGTTLGFAPGHVHDVTNESGLHALSLHVYSPALTFMTQYDMTPEGLVARDVYWSASGETPAASTSRVSVPAAYPLGERAAR